MRPARAFGLFALPLLLLTACGDNDTATDAAPRTIDVDMVDIAFDPETLEVGVGETVRFVFTNEGTVAHDAFIGDAAAQADHEAEMRAPDAHGGHGDAAPNAITVAPGDTAELAHTFPDAGRFEIGCHQEGHYAAGMRITVAVA